MIGMTMSDYYTFDSKEELAVAVRDRVEPGDYVEDCGDLVYVHRDGVVVWRGVNN